MDNNYLITGYWGEPHVTAENDRGVNAAIFGAGRFVFPVGNQFRAEYIGNNTVRVYDGKLIDNGAIAGIPAGRYVDLLVSETGQGMKRNDLIVFQYSKDAATLFESGNFVVVKGAETNGKAADPALTQQDILSDTATLDQMPLWRVSVSNTVISEPVQLFTVCENLGNIHKALTQKMALFSDEVEATIDQVRTFEINVTAADDGYNVKADKTFDEVLAAHNAGKTIVASYGNYTFHLTEAIENEYFTFGAAINTGNNSIVITKDNMVMLIWETFSYSDHHHFPSDIKSGTFASYVKANASGQDASTYLLRNSRLASTETNPTIDGEICWTYE